MRTSRRPISDAISPRTHVHDNPGSGGDEGSYLENERREALHYSSTKIEAFLVGMKKVARTPVIAAATNTLCFENNMAAATNP